MKILMLHGINHNMFGKRDPKQYGTITLDEINANLIALGKELGAELEFFQTNSEGDMCDRIHQGYKDVVALAGALISKDVSDRTWSKIEKVLR